MKTVNVLYSYLVHGLDRSKEDFEYIRQKTEEIFYQIFPSQENTTAEVDNLYYGYCSTSHTGTKSRNHLTITSRNDFLEFATYLEETILPSLQQKYPNELNGEGEGENSRQCHLYLSVAGHSLGGLISRGLIKNIFSEYTPSTTTTTTTTDTSASSPDSTTYPTYIDYLKKNYPYLTVIQPCSFLTLSSPHLGSRVAPPAQAPGLQKKLEKMATRVFTDHLISHIGKELALRDVPSSPSPSENKSSTHEKDANPDDTQAPTDHPPQPILDQFCEKEYMDALAQFPHRTLTGFLRYDLQVKYCTAFACLESPLEALLQEKNSVVWDERTTVGTKIVAISGYEDGDEWAYYQKALFNEQVLKDFYTPETRILPPPNIPEQIQEALKRNGESLELSEDELNQKFLYDNEKQSEILVSTLKKFNCIPYRRVSIDLLLPRGLDRLGTHGACLGTRWTLINKQSIQDIAQKTINFYGHVLVADFLRTSGQQDQFSLPN